MDQFQAEDVLGLQNRRLTELSRYQRYLFTATLYWVGFLLHAHFVLGRFIPARFPRFFLIYL